jgi:hypothetical protein
MDNLKEKIDMTVEGMLPEFSQRFYVVYLSLVVAALLLSLIPFITYILL